MVTSVSDARSNANDQIAHAATVLRRSKNLRTMFEFICRGGTKPKIVTQLMRLTKFSRIQVLQLGGRLADQQLVHKVKVEKETAYEKDRFFAANRDRILRYATNPNKLKNLPTKISPRSKITGPVRVTVKGVRVQIKELTIDDLEQFKAVRKVSNSLEQPISESDFKKGVQRIIAERGKFQDWAVSQMTFSRPSFD